MKNELLARAKDGLHTARTRKCLSGGAKRGHAPRLSEMKNAKDGVFQQTASKLADAQKKPLSRKTPIDN